MARWTRELDLESAQQEQIGGILKSAQARLRDLWAPVAPRARVKSRPPGVRSRALSPDQRQRWNEARRRRGAAKPVDPVIESPHPESPRR